MAKEEVEGAGKSVFTYLRNEVINYSGKSGKQIKLAPQIFELLIDLHSMEETKGKEKQLLNAAIAYFVAPRDVISEERHGAFGFIDDLYLSVYVLKQLRDQIGANTIGRCWRGEGSINEIIDGMYKECIIRLTPSQREKTLIVSGVEEIG